MPVSGQLQHILSKAGPSIWSVTSETVLKLQTETYGKNPVSNAQKEHLQTSLHLLTEKQEQKTKVVKELKLIFLFKLQTATLSEINNSGKNGKTEEG